MFQKRFKYSNGIFYVSFEKIGKIVLFGFTEKEFSKLVIRKMQYGSDNFKITLEQRDSKFVKVFSVGFRKKLTDENSLIESLYFISFFSFNKK